MDMCPRARPEPFLGAGRSSGRHRIVLDVACRCHQVAIIHRIAGEAPLEEMAAEVVAAIDPLGIGSVDAGQRGAQAVGIDGDEDKVDVVVHQAPGEARCAVPGAGGGEHGDISSAVGIVEEQCLLAVAALDDMVRDAWKHDPCGSRHAAGPRPRSRNPIHRRLVCNRNLQNRGQSPFSHRFSMSKRVPHRRHVLRAAGGPPAWSTRRNGRGRENRDCPHFGAAAKIGTVPISGGCRGS